MPSLRLSCFQKELNRLHAHRSFSVSYFRRSQNKCNTDQPNVDILDEKFKYPKREVYQKLVSWNVPTEEPWQRVKHAFKYDYEVAKGLVSGRPTAPIAEGSDILIIGGGIVGTCIAHAIVNQMPNACSVMVLEKDPPEYSTSLKINASGLYQQIPCRTYLEMAQYASEFYRKLPLTFDNPDVTPMQVDFQPNNSLRLVTGNEAPMLEDLSLLYNDMSWRHLLLNPESLKLRFPWMNFDDIALGCLGLQGEGTLNQKNIIATLRERAEKKGVFFQRGEVFGFNFRDWSDFTGPGGVGHFMKPISAVFQDPDGAVDFLNFALVIVAAGPETPNIVRMLDFRNHYNHKVPIAGRKRFVYNLHCPNGPGIDTPMVMDPSGLRLRKIGLTNNFLVWKDPALEDEPSCDNMEVDDLYFKEKILPTLVHRVPAFEDAEVKGAVAGMIDVNEWDGELAIGGLPHFPNIFVCAGFGHDEFILAPAVGRHLMECIVYGEAQTTDLSMFELERFEYNLKLQRYKFS